MHHLLAFTANVPTGTGFTALTGVADQSWPTLSLAGRYLTPWPYRILRALAQSDNLIRARFRAASFQGLFLPEIFPLQNGATGSPDTRVIDYGNNGPQGVQNEELTVEAIHSGGAPERVTAFAWVSDTVPTPVGGPIYTARATSTINGVANGWSFGNLAFDQILPAGRYAVVGMDVTTVGVSAARLVFPGNNKYRPGCIAGSSLGGAILPSYFRFGNIGRWGEFLNTAVPGIEVYTIPAGAVNVAANIDLIKIQ
jgi:hypothetical protein